MNKKGQTITQIFVFLIAIVVFVLVVVYGYSAITKFSSQAEKVALIDFKADLESSVEKIKRSYGTVEQVELTLPSKYKGLCIFDPNATVDQLVDGKANDFMLSAWKTKTENVFFMNPVAKTGIWLQDIAVLNISGFVCVSAGTNHVSFRFEGIGNKVTISEWQ